MRTPTIKDKKEANLFFCICLFLLPGREDSPRLPDSQIVRRKIAVFVAFCRVFFPFFSFSFLFVDVQISPFPARDDHSTKNAFRERLFELKKARLPAGVSIKMFAYICIRHRSLSRRENDGTVMRGVCVCVRSKVLKTGEKQALATKPKMGFPVFGVMCVKHACVLSKCDKSCLF